MLGADSPRAHAGPGEACPSPRQASIFGAPLAVNYHVMVVRAGVLNKSCIHLGMLVSQTPPLHGRTFLEHCSSNRRAQNPL